MDSQVVIKPPEKVTESQNKFNELYQSIVDNYKTLKPLESKVLEYEDRLKSGKITRIEAELLNRDMKEVLGLFDKLKDTSNYIRETRKPPSHLSGDELDAVKKTIKEAEVNAIVSTKVYLLAESFKAHSHMMSSQTPEDRVKHANIAEGLSLAEDIISVHASEIGEEFEKIKKELSARKLD